MNYGDLNFILTLAATVCVALVYFVCHKKGIDITTHKFAFRTITPIVIIFLIVPLLLFSGFSVMWKIVAIVGGLGMGILNYFSIDKRQKYIRDKYTKDHGQ